MKFTSGRTVSLVALTMAACASAWAADPEEGWEKLLHGDSAEALHLADAELASDPEDADWHRIKIEGLLEQGRYQEAGTAADTAHESEQRDLRLLWTKRSAWLHTGQTQKSDAVPERIEELMSIRDWAYRNADSITTYGRAMLLRGADPKVVLDRIFTVAQKLEPKSRDPYLARGDLALEKSDFALAAKVYQEGLNVLPEDPDLLCGLAKAFEDSDREKMTASLEKALKVNPHHVPSLLMHADDLIDREDYGAAAQKLDQIESINPNRPEMWAFRAVLAHLRHEPETEKSARSRALKDWPKNPVVDHVIGRKLSRKYRFAEGAAAQRRALEFDPAYLPAQAQLASDLLRLGDETEGWKLAEEVSKRDAYDVSMFNLMTLHDTMRSKFTTLESPEFTVRMDAGEAAIYGSRVLQLLGDARRKLGEKYGVDVTKPTIVEIFPTQKDFGVRTFGMPDNPGYLGVCFGRVVTANSPAASKGSATNWESVLWHEFCHTVTLQATKNRMPRWLSEGISVYEERQANPAWGEQMSADYREMILGEGLTPVAELSGAFLAPKSRRHLQFAYFESSLVIEFIVSKFGLPALRAVLNDLRDGVYINASLAKRVAPLEKLEEAFAAFAQDLAKSWAHGLDWQEPDPEMLLPGAEAKLDAWAHQHPDNYYVLLRQAARLMEEKKFTEAAAPLQRLIELHPRQQGADSAYVLLARVKRELGDAAGERSLLTAAAELDAAAPEVYVRLMELAGQAGAWSEAAMQAKRYLAVNPLIPLPWKKLAEAAENSGQYADAAGALQTLLTMDPPNPTEIHYRLATIMHKTSDPAARRHLLLALEEAPRHRGALKLLLEMQSLAKPPAP